MLGSLGSCKGLLYAKVWGRRVTEPLSERDGSPSGMRDSWRNAIDELCQFNETFCAPDVANCMVRRPDGDGMVACPPPRVSPSLVGTSNAGGTTTMVAGTAVICWAALLVVFAGTMVALHVMWTGAATALVSPVETPCH